jgi:hypothetical protein
MRLQVLLAAAVLLAPAAARGQGLGDTAAREKQKREAQKKDQPKRVFTNDDLPVGGVPAKDASSAAEASGEAKAGAGASGPEAGEAKPEAGAAGGPGAAGAPEDPIEKERRERQRLETEWRVRFANARERLALAEEASWQEVVRTEFYQGIPVQMKVKEKVETRELVAARQAMADLQEEFRRTGLPPGWAR